MAHADLELVDSLLGCHLDKPFTENLVCQPCWKEEQDVEHQVPLDPVAVLGRGREERVLDVLCCFIRGIL